MAVTILNSGKYSGGFTIIELLIVVLVIAILASITLVSYNGIIQKSKETAVKSDLNQSQTKLAAENIYTGTYPNSLTDVGMSNSGLTYTVSSDKKSYCMQSQNSSIQYFITSDRPPTVGVCHGDMPIPFNCIDKPSACGYPDGTNTGVSLGTTLASVPSQRSVGTGWEYVGSSNFIRTTANNAVIENVELLEGFISIAHSNVIIRNVHLTSGHYFPFECDYLSNGHTCSNLLVENIKLTGGCSMGFSGGYYTIKKSYIEACTAAALIGGSDVIVEDSYINGSGFSLSNGDSSTLRHNTVRVAQTNAYFLSIAGSNSNITIDNNFIYTKPDKLFRYASNIPGFNFKNNRISPDGGGVIGEYVPGGAWTGNYYDKDGSFIGEND